MTSDHIFWGNIKIFFCFSYGYGHQPTPGCTKVPKQECVKVPVQKCSGYGVEQ